MKTVTLIPGDGIGPEISQAVVDIIKSAGVNINWDIQSAGADVAEKEGTPKGVPAFSYISKAGFI